MSFHPDPIWIPILAIALVPMCVVGIPISRAIVRRIDRQPPRPADLPPEIAVRLERMEHALDSIAIEVERITEGQRFTTKLLAERNNSPLQGVPERQP